MRRIKQLLTMRFGAGASTREIARELGVAPSTVREYLGRAAAAGIGWPLAADVTDENLVARLFANAGVRAGARFHAEPDWASLVRELKRPGVNLMVLWEEYARDASTTLDQARRALAVALAEDGQERRRTEAVASRIVTLEERARAALAGQREDLALEAAEAIASLETDRDAGQQARCMLGSEIARLRRCVSQGEQRFAQLQRGRRLARVAEAARVSRHGRVEPAVSMRGTLGEAEATLARLRERQDLVIDAEEILGDLEPGAPQPSAEDRLADAGFGPPTRPTAASVLARLKQA